MKTLISIVFLTCFGRGFEASRLSAAEAWEAVLRQLNQSAVYTGFPVTESAIDLSSLYVEEFQKTADRWKVLESQKKSKHPDISRQSLRKSKNLFFHREARLRNEEVLAFAKKHYLGKEISKNSRAYRTQSWLENHPVAKRQNMAIFENSSQIGFCFGRALMAHHYLLEQGIPQNKIAKIFAIGDLLVEGQMWKFHVAVLFKDSLNRLMVLDAMQPKALELDSWLRVVEQYGIKKPLSRVRFYLTEGSKYLPSQEKHDKETLENKHLKPFFDRVLSTL